MPSTVLRAAFVCCVALAVSYAGGCGGAGPPELSGTVKYKGEVISGTLMIKGPSGEKSAIVGPAGGYKIIEPPTGECKIAMVTEAKGFPAKYKTIEQTTYRETINPGQKTLDLNFP